jgi:HEAT repeat protein
MADSDPSRRAVPPGESLPPVEPPSAAFLVQLFLIPGVIVGVIVLVWVFFHWIAETSSRDPEEYVQTLRRDSPDVWQTAEHLAEMLRNDRNNELRGSAKLAGALANILEQRITAGKMDEGAVNLRVYLSSALGQFNTPGGLPALLKAVSTNRDKAELPVRRAALDAVGSLVTNLAAAHVPLPSDPELLDTVLQASHDPEAVIRLRAAFDLGLIGGPQAEKRLVEMLDDLYPDVSYNAATALARHGDVRALGTLAQMLDPDQTASLQSEEPEEREEKQWLIAVNGLRAIEQLAAANPQADMSRLNPAIERLKKAKPPLPVLDELLRVEETFHARSKAVPPATGR